MNDSNTVPIGDEAGAAGAAAFGSRRPGARQTTCPGQGSAVQGGPTVCGSEVRLGLVAAVPGGAEVEVEDGAAAEAGDGLGAVTYAVPSWPYCLNALCTGTR
jgi:hypothetical protein